MLNLIKSLVAHKGDANEVLLRTLLSCEAARGDDEIRALCHHILISNRFWSAAIREVPFDVDREVHVEHALEDLPALFREMQRHELAWLETATESDCLREVAHPLIPGGACSVAEAFTQVCLHSHGHRAQLMKMLRRHGVTPEPQDFILWLEGRGQADRQ